MKQTDIAWVNCDPTAFYYAERRNLASKVQSSFDRVCMLNSTNEKSFAVNSCRNEADWLEVQ